MIVSLNKFETICLESNEIECAKISEQLEHSKNI